MFYLQLCLTIPDWGCFLVTLTPIQACEGSMPPFHYPELCVTCQLCVNTFTDLNCLSWVFTRRKGTSYRTNSVSTHERVLWTCESFDLSILYFKFKIPFLICLFSQDCLICKLMDVNHVSQRQCLCLIKFKTYSKFCGIRFQIYFVVCGFFFLKFYHLVI